MHEGQLQVALFVLEFTKRHKARAEAHCSSFTAFSKVDLMFLFLFFGAARKAHCLREK